MLWQANNQNKQLHAGMHECLRWHSASVTHTHTHAHKHMSIFVYSFTWSLRLTLCRTFRNEQVVFPRNALFHSANDERKKTQPPVMHSLLHPSVLLFRKTLLRISKCFAPKLWWPINELHIREFHMHTLEGLKQMTPSRYSFSVAQQLSAPITPDPDG